MAFDEYIGVAPKIKELLDLLEESKTFDYINFAQSPINSDASTIGNTYFDSDNGTLSVKLNSDVTMQVGQEILIRAVNKTGSIISNGKVVHVAGATGNRPKIELVDSTDLTIDCVLGLATENIGINEYGYVCTFGLVRGLNTQGIVEGTRLYASTNGTWSSTQPVDGYRRFWIGIVVKEHVSDGWILVNVREIPYMFGSVSTGNYSYFNGSGLLINVGTATTYDDLLPSSVTVSTSGSNVPSFTVYNGGLKAYEFVGSSLMKEINMGFQHSHKRKADSSIDTHLHLYIPNDVTGGDIRFGLEYTWTNINEVGSVTPTTIYKKITIPSNDGIKNNHILDFGSITGTGKTKSSMFMCRIFRDPTHSEDTFGSSVWLKSADQHYEKDKQGSDTLWNGA